MYDLHRLRLLRELSHRGTLAAVADALGYSPSAVSHQLGILEREVKAPLLEPAGRGVRLTPAAAMLVARTETIMRELERAEADIAAGRTDIIGTIRVATFQTAAHTLVLDAIDRLTDRHPRLTVTFAHLNAEAAIPALLARDFDLVLSEDYPGNPPAPHPGVTTRAIADDPLFLAIPADWSARGLADLADAPWGMEPPGTAARAWTIATCRAAGFEPHVRYETADLGLHAAIAARGHAAAFLPRLAHAPSPAIRLVPTGQARTITLSTRTGSDDNTAVQAFTDAVTVP
ncbi:LysR family transcriptional regulator [Nocardiopsis potens]|uniref:LysR family transcriptional regulator n=1 Tax=Nocardiopsis potens TaxID=1246458 RepID=UPI000346C125|nr:LysR family transcriptional regulator [Nocardiopsis potens]